MTETHSYSLGASEAELARLEAPKPPASPKPTALFLGRAGNHQPECGCSISAPAWAMWRCSLVQLVGPDR